GVGFSTSAKQKASDGRAASVIQNALKKAFAPEFLNRIDDVVIFNSLEKDDIHKIIDIELKSLFGRIEELGYYINLTQEAKDYIADKGYDSAYGARPLKRAIQKYLEDPLAEEIIQSKVVEGSIINVTFDDVTEELIFSIKNPKKKKEDSEPKKED
ncbi:MAG: ATP-dependent Clp protease ATP-binding subunit, partial [Flavobacteriales bacterium]|nr:ATP-dependent Clp protease ATP-binding subunit [Flavobacteriales bacterium]